MQIKRQPKETKQDKIERKKMGISRFQTFKMNIFPKDFLKNKDFEVILCDATVFPNKQSA